MRSFVRTRGPDDSSSIVTHWRKYICRLFICTICFKLDATYLWDMIVKCVFAGASIQIPMLMLLAAITHKLVSHEPLKKDFSSLNISKTDIGFLCNLKQCWVVPSSKRIVVRLMAPDYTLVVSWIHRARITPRGNPFQLLKNTRGIVSYLLEVLKLQKHF